jgi:hypothetical protein
MGREYTEAGQNAKRVVKADREHRQADLLRHIMGNPFRPYRSPSHWSSSIVTLAQTLHSGEDVVFALADALEEAGHPELAEHFRAEKDHPKGCWALDLLLDKK